MEHGQHDFCDEAQFDDETKIPFCVAAAWKLLQMYQNHVKEGPRAGTELRYGTCIPPEKYATCIIIHKIIISISFN